MDSLLIVLGSPQYAAAWGDVLFYVIAALTFGYVLHKQVKAIKHEHMMAKLRGNTEQDVFQTYPSMTRLILILICVIVALAWPFYWGYIFVGFVQKWLTKKDPSHI